MMHRITLSIVLCTCFLLSFSQQKAERLNSGEIIQAGIKLYDNGNFKEALREFEKVPVGDTNYVLALYESALTCTADSQYSRGLSYCEKGLTDRSNPERDPEFLALYGALYDYSNQPDKALHIFDSAMQVYPAYTNLYINKGTTLIRMKRYREAEEVLQKAALINPYSASVHLKLGLAALNQGKVLPGFLCMLASLTVEPSNNFSKNAINILSEIAKSTDEITKLHADRTEQPSGNFQLVEQILLSKIALDKNYKIIIGLDDFISRQIQVVFEKLAFDENDRDYYMQYYVPLYKKIYTDKKFEYFVNHIFSNVNLPAIQEFNRRKKKDIDVLKTDIIQYLHLIRASREIQFTKRSYDYACYQFTDEGLYGKGVVKDKSLPTGPWIFYYTSGNKKSEGQFTDKGERDGKFSYYYFNGKQKAIEFYQNGKQDGIQTYYAESGALESIAPYKNGEAEGMYTSYYSNGVTKTLEPYSNGKLHGIKKSFYRAGPIQLEESYVNGKRQGSAKTFHLNGRVETEGAYSDNELNGNFKSWNSEGVLVAEGSYALGKLVGTLKRYYENGQLQSIEQYDKGVLEGEYVSYHENGKLAYRYLNKNGKTTGDVNYFDEDEKLFSTLSFDNDRLKSGRYFDKTGKQISISELKKGRLDLLTYGPEGARQALVPYGEKGQVHGTKRYYFGSGKERLIETYTQGELNGPTTAYHESANKSYEVDYVNNSRNGYYSSWYSAGGIREEGWYEADMLQGTWLNYNKHGKLLSKSAYLNNERNGLKNDYWPNGRINTTYLFHKDQLVSMTEYDTTGVVINTVKLENGNGKFISRYPNGKLSSECVYVNHEINGPYKAYYPDGSLKIQQFYKHGLLDSNYTAYSYGGKLRVEGNYFMNEKVGTWKFYTAEGKLYSIETYKSDKLEGKTLYYHANGKLDTEIEMKNNDRHGLYKRYAEDGSLMYQLRYKEGVKTGYSYLDKNGQLLPEIPLTLGNGTLNAFYQNGHPSASMVYVDGKLNGAYTLYHPNGKIMLTDKEVFGETEGLSTKYFEDGKIRSQYNYVQNNLHGSYKEYNSKGILKEEGNYYDDDLHGEVRFYDDAGKLKQSRLYYYGLLLEVK
ncbi:tetratricopeptide repeat protein [Flavihumibacter sp. CACIAM 22H1]|uniref:tetratricopeptide repeat protein n=1 Tax=Flavihumibacter sp. CACIAM 22H1 TaxID=1812911 RepID=UPI0007A89744|nr:tetratricopeptide repeat protein [Flavihumibacter sp. CACIAM 22H1]KYP16259.1 MAG: hypothetical protein A1D16_20160 [Flavihumibacter sp. CACIAM 22H1]